MVVQVYDDNQEIVAEVEYNNNLDFWDGHNHTSGRTGRHKGLTMLDSGEYVLIHGTQWESERDNAEIISAEQAVQEILQSGNIELFDEVRFVELKELKNKNLKKEVT